jgi:hypothetical protein
MNYRVTVVYNPSQLELEVIADDKTTLGAILDLLERDEKDSIVFDIEPFSSDYDLTS